MTLGRGVLEVAHYRTDETNYWAAYWYKGRIFANGYQSFDVFVVNGLEER